MDEQELDNLPKVDAPKAGFDNEGHVVVKNRAYRRRWKNRAMLEGKKSKKYYTQKKRKSRRKK